MILSFSLELLKTSHTWLRLLFELSYHTYAMRRTLFFEPQCKKKQKQKKTRKLPLSSYTQNKIVKMTKPSKLFEISKKFKIPFKSNTISDFFLRNANFLPI